jgi:hypothetical protein
MNQAQFSNALFDPNAALPAGIVDPQGRAAPKRFCVYRNNVTAGLVSITTAAFPVIRTLLGDPFFTALAVEYIRAHPPKQRLMMLYGAEFPQFLREFPPVAHLGYLPDVARLEQSIRESYHSADVQAPLLADITNWDAAQLSECKMDLAPSLRLLVSDWPIYGIWAATTRGGPAPVARAETVLILRKDFDPVPLILSADQSAFVKALMRGLPLGDALAQGDDTPALQQVLDLLLTHNSVARIWK